MCIRDRMSKIPQPDQRKIKYGPEERIQMSRLRQTIAKRLKHAQDTAAMLTTFNEVDMSKLISFRKENQEEFKNKFNTKLGFMSFFVKASIKSLKQFPSVNSEVENNDIIYKNYYNISFAVGTDKGLVVPVLKFANEMPLLDISKSVKDLAERARSKKIAPSEMEGSTFTISNLGMFGISEFTSIINQPNSAILSVGAIVQKPIVKDEKIIIGNTMKLTLAFDHRVVDGATGSAFLNTLRNFIENPVGILSTQSKLGKATQYIQPFWFSERTRKKTGLWLKGFPKLVPTDMVDISKVSEKELNKFVKAQPLSCAFIP